MTAIAGKNVLVTGGASGLGRLVALKMAGRGATLVLWDLHEGNTARVLDELKAQRGRQAWAYCCDVSDRSQVYQTAARVKQEVGPVHILVNNAGVVTGKPLLDASDQEIERTMGVNTMALFWTCKAFLGDMIRAGSGHVVTVASAAGVIGVAGLADYCASKWAAVGLNESLRAELRKTAPGVRTTVVCPHYVDTGMFRGVKSRASWLLPILKQDRVAEHIVRAVERNRPALMLPRLVGLVPVLRVLPVALFDAAARRLGVQSAMETFVGRAGSGSE